MNISDSNDSSFNIDEDEFKTQQTQQKETIKRRDSWLQNNMDEDNVKLNKQTYKKNYNY